MGREPALIVHLLSG